MKKVSIVIPIYNGEEYIDQTLNYILHSTYENLELILVNDGSTDRSLSICERLKRKDSRVFVFTKKNEGVVAARNFGVLKATGDYLCFCDQDDIVGKDTYMKQVSVIEKSNSDICMCSVGRSINGKKTDFEISENAQYKDVQILENLLYPLLFNGYNVPVKMKDVIRYPFIWNCMFRMTFWKENQIKFRSYVNFEDDLLVKIEALSKAKKVSTISYAGYYWRVNLKSESYAHKYVKNIKEKQQKCYEDMYKSISVKVKDYKTLELFKQVTFCKQYLDAVHNITSPYVNKNYRLIKAYYQNTIYERNFESCIEARKYLKKGRVKPKILLPVLAKKMTLLSFFLSVVLDQILLCTLQSQTLTKLERGLKRSRQDCNGGI